MTNTEKVYQFFKEYPGHLKTSKKDIANRLNVSPEDITKAKAFIREDKEPSYTELDEFAEKQGFNPDNASLIWYKNKDLSVAVKKQQEDIDKEKLYNYLKDGDFNLPGYKGNPVTNSVAVLNIFDAHVDKVGYVGLGGLHELNENLNILKSSFKRLFDELLKEGPETVIFPVGNDFFNTNGSTPATFKGTPQQIGVHWEDSFQAGVNFYRSVIDYMIQHTNVILVNIPGNHDKTKVFYLGQVLKALYENHPNIECMLDRDNRKYVFKNDILFGFQHGDIAKRKITKLPSVMSIEQAQLWGKASHRVWILGDIHHKEEYTSYSTLEEMGVDIKFLRPSTSADKWHTEEMWIGAKKSISYMLYKNSGEQILENELFI